MFALEPLIFRPIDCILTVSSVTTSEVLLGMTFYNVHIFENLRNLGCPLKKMKASLWEQVLLAARGDRWGNVAPWSSEGEGPHDMAWLSQCSLRDAAKIKSASVLSHQPDLFSTTYVHVLYILGLTHWRNWEDYKF